MYKKIQLKNNVLLMPALSMDKNITVQIPYRY